jgi:putative SOS response-associated peptidase YedK
MKWGLIPFWSKTGKADFSTINVRNDKLETAAAWREPWKNGRRCLIPVDVFYEWEKLSDEDKKKKVSRPWAVSLTTNKMFSFGGLWDRWRDRASDTIVESFTIITVETNEVLEPFHNRCPLIIEPKDYERWLAEAPPEAQPIDLVRTYSGDGMRAWRVAPLKGNGPELLTPLTPTVGNRFHSFRVGWRWEAKSC